MARGSDFGRHATAVMSLYGLQLASLVLPLVLLPFLTRRLGPEVWGVLAVQTSLSILMVVFLEFGFGFGATREAAAVRESRRLIGRIVSDVAGARLLLTLLVACVWVMVWIAVPIVREQPSAYFWTFLLTLAQGFSPSWFFQAVGALPYVLIREFVARMTSTVLIVLIVHQSVDAWMVPCIQSLTLLAATIITSRNMIKRVQWQSLSLRSSAVLLRSNVHLCLNRLVLVLAPTGNTFLLGSLSPQSVGVYAAAERASNAARGLLSPVSQVAFPEIVVLFKQDADRARKVVKRILFGLVAGAALMAGVTMVSADIIVDLLFGNAFAQSADVLRIIIVSVPLFAVVQVIGLQWLLPLKADRAFFVSTMVGAVTNVILGVALAPLFGAVGMAWGLLASEVALVLGLLLYTEFFGPARLRIFRRHSV